ncbi:TIR domain-containing protein [Amycolatopsis pretoriensis]|uniref:TIR domain-containing protein n=1 Tax=Amycolatopsis pretoriensis TaxID=218821 RepID=A0A1H5RHJ9_9PSEU|nr:TIR domain-containing protein [Amycolatopsis pretoriensis]SEF37853.1 TIR domain-containing protein [Amycolatopsis pretoriensis]
MTDIETYDYDIAVSFAGEDRQLVRDVVDRLKEQEVKVFFDEDSTAEMWGENLLDFLQAVYGRRARYAVLFISRHYVAKKWTNYERQAAQDRAFQQTAPYLLPVRVDDSELPGLLSTIGYVDAEFAGTTGIVDAIVRKLGDQAQTREPKFDGRAPRSPEAVAVVLSERPPGWEFLLYGGLLHQGIVDLEDKYRDHVIEYAPHSGQVISESDGLPWLESRLTSVSTIVASLERVLSDAAQTAAFGRPGEPGDPGDPERIIHLAKRMTGIYGEVLGWAAAIRATGFEDDAIRHIADLEARLADLPIEQIRKFVEDFMQQMDGLTPRLLAGEDVDLTFSVTIEMDPAKLGDYQRALRAYAAKLSGSF